MATDTVWTTGGVKTKFYNVVRDQPDFKDLRRKDPSFDLRDDDYMVSRSELGIESRLDYDSLTATDVVMSTEEALDIRIEEKVAEEAFTGKNLGEIAAKIVEIMREQGHEVADDSEEDAA